MKRARQAEILKIIQSVDVETQEQLLDELKRRGFASTQATISRDIKELRLVKEMAGGGYRYVVSERKGMVDSDVRLRNIFKEGVVSVDPVSYTHLDVYKRQLPRQRPGGSALSPGRPRWLSGRLGQRKCSHIKDWQGYYLGRVRHGDK